MLGRQSIQIEGSAYRLAERLLRSEASGMLGKPVEIGKADGDLLAHPNMVSNRYHMDPRQAQPVFFYDFSSPYSYFAAHRVDDLLPVQPHWQPILFGALISAIGKEPWSLRKGPSRNAQMHECEERAAKLGLPLQWPRDWPLGTYSILAGRAALVAEEQGRLREFSRAAFNQGLGRGRDLTDLDVVLEAATEATLDPATVAEQVETPRIKERLRRATEEAVEIGVTGVPTVMIGGNLFWGDDRLEDAARTLAAGPSAADR